MVRAKLSKTERLEDDQILQDLARNCTEMTYNLYSSEEMEQLILYPDGGACSDIGAARAVVNVRFLPCPDAFELNDDRCECESRLLQYGNVECRIFDANEQYIVRKAESKFWLKFSYNTNGTYEGLILYPTCPVGYCNSETVNISLTQLDVQCSPNRSGLLCGACVANKSLMLGSSNCQTCSNSYLALLLPFAAAGIALVIFLSFLRLTVATGMINSIILYANIVQANKSLFFPGSTNINVLAIFIAWMNLDLGFHTCFYDGMDAYVQTWLQVVFPIYVWFLVCLIMLTSRYSVTVTKLIGSNPIAVLATLLLMSYTKILKITIEVYSSVDLDLPGNMTEAVWLKDANEPYLESRHLVLAVVTTIFIILFFLPYTLLLLFGYKLYRYTGKRCTRWLITIKPLLDSYYAPYKIHTRCWTGFLLLIRCVLYIVFSFNSLGHTISSLLAIVITFSVLIALLSVKIYAKLYINLIEVLVYLNLVVLSATTALVAQSDYLVNSLIGIVFVIMMGIIVYHFHVNNIAKSKLWSKICAKLATLKEANEATPVQLLAPAAETQQSPVCTKSVVSLREPLLSE